MTYQDQYPTINIVNLAEYGPLAKRTEKLMAPGNRLMHAVLGMITENGEFTTEVKRMAVYERHLTTKMFDHIAEELGDWMWYAAIVFDVFGETFSEDDNYTPIGWKTYPIESKLTLCSVMMATVSNCVMVAMEHALQDGGDISRSEHALIVLGPLRQAIRVIRLTISALLGESALLDDTEVNIKYPAGVRLEAVLAQNIAKLQKRFPEAYSNDAAEARADKDGLTARQS